MASLQRAALKLLEENIKLKESEKVIVVTDREKCPVFNSICNAVELKGGYLRKIHITNKRNHSSPLPEFRNVFQSADVIIGVTDKSISHCPETRIARKRYGARVVSMVEVDKNLFLKAMKADRKKIKEIGSKLAEKLRKCKIVRIENEKGTDISINVVNDAIGVDDGNCTTKGKLINLPYGEVAMAPITIADGTIAIDFSRRGINPRDNAKIKLIKGRIVWCNEKAKKFVNFLKKVGGGSALRIVELGFGINPHHKKLVGKIIHDEKIVGSVHFGFGGFGDKRKCKIHEDLVVLKPNVFFDNRLVIQKGRIL